MKIYRYADPDGVEVYLLAHDDAESRVILDAGLQRLKATFHESGSLAWVCGVDQAHMFFGNNPNV